VQMFIKREKISIFPLHQRLDPLALRDSGLRSHWKNEQAAECQHQQRTWKVIHAGYVYFVKSISNI